MSSPLRSVFPRWPIMLWARCCAARLPLVGAGTSAPARVLAVALLLMAVAVTTVAGAMRTDAGMGRVIGWMAQSDRLGAAARAWGGSDLFAPAGSAVSGAANAAALAAAVAPPPPSWSAWLDRLSHERVLDTPLVVHLQPWSSLSPRMERLAAAQGITIRPWDRHTPAPARRDAIAAASEFWVRRTPNGWTITAHPADLLRSHPWEGHALTDMDVVRLVLWCDALTEQDAWRAAHPAPQPPASVQPPPITVVFVPGDVGAAAIFWNTSIALTLLALAAGALTGALGWEGLRRDGVLEPYAAVPRSTAALLALWGVPWSVTLVVGCVIVALGSAGALALLHAPIPWRDGAALMALEASAATAGVWGAVAVLVWFPGRAWRVWGRLIVVVGLLTAEIWGMPTSQDRAVAVWGASPLVWMVVLGCVAVAGAAAGAAAWRSDSFDRQGWRRD